MTFTCLKYFVFVINFQAQLFFDAFDQEQNLKFHSGKPSARKQAMDLLHLLATGNHWVSCVLKVHCVICYLRIYHLGIIGQYPSSLKLIFSAESGHGAQDLSFYSA